MTDAELSPHERRLIGRLRTPLDVQRYLNRLPYNEEPHGRATLRSFRGVVGHGCAHCLEAALFAAVILERHGFPPRLLSFESIDHLDHVIFLYRQDGRWGSVARSRDPGLHGRLPVFRSPRALAMSYVDIGALMGGYDWRWAGTNVWKVERALLDYPHTRIRTSDVRYQRLKAEYRAFRERNGGRKPVYYRGRHHWTPIPYDPAHWALGEARVSRGRSRVTAS